MITWRSGGTWSQANASRENTVASDCATWVSRKLGDRKERVIAAGHAPPRIDTLSVRIGKQANKHLSNAAAAGSRVDVPHRAAIRVRRPSAIPARTSSQRSGERIPANRPSDALPTPTLVSGLALRGDPHPLPIIPFAGERGWATAKLATGQGCVADAAGGESGRRELR